MANIDFYRQITPSNDTTLYGHNSVDEAGFPKSPGNFRLSTILSQFITAEDNEIKSHFEFVEGLDRNYTLNYKGVAIASLRLPPDRFLKEAKFNPETKVLTLTFATEGEDSVVDIDFSSLIDVYSAGNGLTLADATFSLKLQAGEARLRVSGAGLALDLTDITTSIATEAQTRGNADNALSVRIKTLEDTWNTFSTEFETTKTDLQNTQNALAETNTALANTNRVVNDLNTNLTNTDNTVNQIKSTMAQKVHTHKASDITDLLDTIYPVGSIYLTIGTSSLNPGSSPASWLGGKWQLLPEDKALWTANSEAGNTISSALPNIKGYFARVYMEWNGDWNNGCCYATSNIGNGRKVFNGSWKTGPGLGIDASRSSSIYKDNQSIVQPPAYKVYAWRRVS